MFNRTRLRNWTVAVSIKTMGYRLKLIVCSSKLKLVVASVRDCTDVFLAGVRLPCLVVVGQLQELVHVTWFVLVQLLPQRQTVKLVCSNTTNTPQREQPVTTANIIRILQYIECCRQLKVPDSEKLFLLRRCAVNPWIFCYFFQASYCGHSWTIHELHLIHK